MVNINKETNETEIDYCMRLLDMEREIVSSLNVKKNENKSEEEYFQALCDLEPDLVLINKAAMSLDFYDLMSCKNEDKTDSTANKRYIKRLSFVIKVMTRNDLIDSRFFEYLNEESLNEYFLRIMLADYAMVENLVLPKNKMSEYDYYRTILQEAEKENNNLLYKINNEIFNFNFIDSNFSEILHKEDYMDDNMYYFRIICVSKIILRNTIVTPKEHYEREEIVKAVNEIIFNNKKLMNFIYYYPLNHYGSYCSNHDDKHDLIATAEVNLLANLLKYNGQFDITTFAQLHLKNGISNFIAKQNNLSAYGNEKFNIIRKAINRNISKGYSETEARSVALIMEDEEIKKAGLSASTISSILEQKETFSLQQYDPDFQPGISETYNNPEDEMIRKERLDAFNKICASLKPYQKFLLWAMNGEITEAPTSSEGIGRYPEFVQLIKDEKMFNLIKTDADGNEFVKKDIVKQLYDETMMTASINARNSSLFSQKEKDKRYNFLNKFGSSICNSNYELLTEEDEDLIFSLED